MRNTIILLFVIFLYNSCTEIDDPLQPIDIKDIIALSVEGDPFNIPADSNSIRIIRATIGTKAVAGQTISFNTTHGVLTKVGETPTSGSSQSLSIQADFRDAAVQLNALNIPSDQVIVSGSIGNNSNMITLQFNNAYPNNFQINPNAVIGDTLQPIIVEVEAFRDNGVVSENIRFMVETSAPDSIKLNHPQYVLLKNQKATFEIENVSKKAGPISIGIIMPISETDSTNKTFEYIYQ